MPDQGEIVLVPVPYTDLSSQKRRPVIVISSDEYNRRSPDVVVVAMTSNPASLSHSFTIDSPDLVTGSLNRPGTVRVDNTLHKALIVKRFGKVSKQIIQHIRQEFDRLTALSA